jgi:hypothetical protein
LEQYDTTLIAAVDEVIRLQSLCVERWFEHWGERDGDGQGSLLHVTEEGYSAAFHEFAARCDAVYAFYSHVKSELSDECVDKKKVVSQMVEESRLMNQHYRDVGNPPLANHVFSETLIAGDGNCCASSVAEAQCVKMKLGNPDHVKMRETLFLHMRDNHDILGTYYTVEPTCPTYPVWEAAISDCVGHEIPAEKIFERYCELQAKNVAEDATNKSAWCGEPFLIVSAIGNIIIIVNNGSAMRFTGI